jgi:uncharacterized protein
MEDKQMVNIPKEVMDLLTTNEGVNKSIGTVDANGVPNIAYMGSINAVGADTVMVADMGTVHTKANLDGPNKNVVIALFKAPMTAYQIKGTFQTWQTSGPVYDGFAKAMKARGYPPAKAIAIIKVDAVFSISPMQNSKKLA